MASSGDGADMLEKVKALFRTGTGKSAQPWKVREFRVREWLGRPYRGTVEIVAETGTDFSTLLGKSCALEVTRGWDRARAFKGIVCKVEQLGAHAKLVLARIWFAPALLALSHGRDSRVFEDMTAPEIVKDVLTRGLEPFERNVILRVTRTYPKKDYVVQYQESDLDFIQRIIFDAGMTYYFDQGDETETLVVVDSNDCHVKIETMGGGEPATAAESPPPKDWTGIGLKDENGEGMAGARFVLILPNGTRIEDTLNQVGEFRIEGIASGDCKVEFPDHEAEETDGG